MAFLLHRQVPAARRAKCGLKFAGPIQEQAARNKAREAADFRRLI
jgi:hypothetical protein